ncbi:Hydrogenase isoenzymes formation protein HypE [Phycisphaerae bacterium RAS1]|nr:Hydrogenase isoenzymes formation protein HypE [Phycisphaerae bacterium RAS1]
MPFPDLSISMAHGAGGTASRRLVEEVFKPAFANPALDALADAAILDVQNLRLAFTTDCFVVRPLVFPGGSIGELAINGTVNDLAVSGATPIAIAAGFIIEDGLDAGVLRREVAAMARAARQARVAIVAGDTKVVERGKADGLYITASGIGCVDPLWRLGPQHVRPGDAVLLSGPIADHGISILLARHELALDEPVRSDTRPLTALISALRDATGQNVRWMRDATRGGVATVLNELAQAAGAGVQLEEARIPVSEPVRQACELLGLDPLHVANEGQFVAVIAPQAADRALTALRSVAGDEAAAIVGRITDDAARRVLCRSALGATRVIEMLTGDPLPRIC